MSSTPTSLNMTPGLSGAIVLVAKCPIPGKSKTRLSKLVGQIGSADLAKSMLSDVLEVVGQCEDLDEIPKILLYAPGTKDGAKHMSTLLSSLNFSSIEIQSNENTHIKSAKHAWILLPMMSSSSNESLTSSNLGDKLSSALQRVRSILQSDTNPFTSGNIVFLGMDSPSIPLSEIIYTLSTSTTEEVHLCPAQDGGYGMISIPNSLPSQQVFQGVRWSSPLTAVSQIKALTDCIHDYSANSNGGEILINIGKMMHDIDEPEDIWKLAEILVSERNHSNVENKKMVTKVDVKKELDVLLQFSAPAMALDSSIKIDNDNILSCRHTWESFLKLGLTNVEATSEGGDIFVVCKDSFQKKD